MFNLRFIAQRRKYFNKSSCHTYDVWFVWNVKTLHLLVVNSDSNPLSILPFDEKLTVHDESVSWAEMRQSMKNARANPFNPTIEQIESLTS